MIRKQRKTSLATLLLAIVLCACALVACAPQQQASSSAATSTSASSTQEAAATSTDSEVDVAKAFPSWNKNSEPLAKLVSYVQDVTNKDSANYAGWTTFSMANDWATIYGDGVTKTQLPADVAKLAEAA